MKKRCSKCKKQRAISKFYKNKSKKDGYDEYCRDCRNARTTLYKQTSTQHAKKARQAGKKYYKKNRDYILKKARRTFLKRKYGLSKAAYKKMLESQDYVCAVCGSDSRLVVDHDHNTGKVRGLLCYRCNIGLGYFERDFSWLRAAKKYLRAVKSN